MTDEPKETKAVRWSLHGYCAVTGEPMTEEEAKDLVHALAAAGVQGRWLRSGPQEGHHMVVVDDFGNVSKRFVKAVIRWPKWSVDEDRFPVREEIYLPPAYFEQIPDVPEWLTPHPKAPRQAEVNGADYHRLLESGGIRDGSFLDSRYAHLRRCKVLINLTAAPDVCLVTYFDGSQEVMGLEAFLNLPTPFTLKGNENGLR